MNALPSPKSIPQLGDTYGAIFIGLLFSAILFGFTNVQATLFFYANSRDPLAHKIIVVWLWLLNIFYLAIVSHLLYSTLILGHLGELIPWDVKAMSFMEMLIISTVHILYTLRIWKITPMKSKILPSVLTLLTSITLAFELFAFSKIDGISNFEGLGGLKWELIASSSVTCFTDIAISGSLIYILGRRHTAELSWTGSVTTMLYSYSLNTGVIASLLSIAALIPLPQIEHSLVFEGIRIVLSTVHINSFIAMLNARYYFQPRNSTTLILHSHETSSTTSRFSVADRNPGHLIPRPTINEDGLPLFRSEPEESKMNHPEVLEVVVVKEEHSSTI